MIFQKPLLNLGLQLSNSLEKIFGFLYGYSAHRVRYRGRC
jgi:hypothetical protein